MTKFDISRQDILGLFDNRLHDKNRYLYPINTTKSVEATVFERFSKLREEEGESITLVDGAFDVPHNNHEWYLRHCKLIGAFAAFTTSHQEDATFTDFASYLKSNSRYIEQHKLAVTVDADERIAFKKSGIEAKGGIERPIYPWSARADRLAGYHLSITDTTVPTVDLVTVEGDSIHRNTPLESSLVLAAFLKSESLLDQFVIFGEHDTTVSEAQNSGLEPIVIEPSGAIYETNPQTEKSWGSSSIIKRAQGEAVLHPVTRPEDLQ